MPQGIDRRAFLAAAGTGAAAALWGRYGVAPGAQAGEAPGGGRPPNIIFLLTDDQGYGDLSCHGHPFLKTPNFDRLREQSVRFPDFQVSPICSPTRCALMTGRHEYRSGVTHTRGPGQQMDLQAVTIAQVLKSAGYATGLFGKWHLGEPAEYQPFNRGFDESWSYLTGIISEDMPAQNRSYFDPILLHRGKHEQTSGYYTDAFFNLAMKWIDSVRGRQPFFCYLPTGAVHAPSRCSAEYAKLYADQAKTPELAAYFGTMANLDDNLGRLLAQLKAWDLERDTLLIYMSDNGAAVKAGFFKDGAPMTVYNAGMRGGKGSVYQGGTRVPSFWRWPAAFPGGVDVAQLASNVDFFPTIVEITGAKAPAGVQLDGRSLLPLLQNPKADWSDRFVFLHASNQGGPPEQRKNEGCAVRNGQFSLIDHKHLYDLKADPGQNNDVSAQHAPLVAQMQAAYDQWWSEVAPHMRVAALPAGSTHEYENMIG
jgi:arylsulfatase